MKRLAPPLVAVPIALLLALPVAASADSNGKVVVAASATIKPGKALIRVFCNGPLPCDGTLRLVATPRARDGDHRKPKSSIGKSSIALGSASFHLAPGSSRVLRLKLSRRARQLLERGRPLKARAMGTGLHPHAVKLKRAAR